MGAKKLSVRFCRNAEMIKRSKAKQIKNKTTEREKKLPVIINDRGLSTSLLCHDVYKEL